MLVWPAPEDANPYVRKLARALSQRGVELRASSRLAALCARPEGASWLHLHWPEWMLHHPSRALYRARSGWLLGLLDLARARGLRLAWTAHNLVGHDDPHPDLGLRARRALLARCELVLGHFAEAERDLRGLGFSGRFVCVPHPPFADEHPQPFATPDARRAYRRARGVGDDTLLLASPGAMEPYKNLPALARALAGRPDEKLGWIVAGRCSPELLAALREAAARDPRVALDPGFQSRAALSELIAASDAILLGHNDFYTSGVAVLALTLGAPLIAPPRHQLGAWRGEPFFAPLEAVDAPSLSAAIERVRAMGRGAFARARAFARQSDWSLMAATLDRAMFGAAS